MTGIDAGLKGIRSILEGYVNCLEIKLKQNEDVGFCDYIRSVGVCELVWKEAYNLLDIGGRVLLIGYLVMLKVILVLIVVVESI